MRFQRLIDPIPGDKDIVWTRFIVVSILSFGICLILAILLFFFKEDT